MTKCESLWLRLQYLARRACHAVWCWSFRIFWRTPICRVRDLQKYTYGWLIFGIDQLWFRSALWWYHTTTEPPKTAKARYTATVARELDDASNPLFFRFVSVNHSERIERIVAVGGERSRTGLFCNINFTLIAETVRWILIYLLVRTQVNTLINNKHADTSECYCNINDIPIETSSATPTWHITQCNKVTAIVRQQRKMTKLSNEYNTSRNNCERSRCHPRVIMG